MQKIDRTSLTIYFLIGLVFCLPYLILFKNFNFTLNLNWSNFFQALVTSCLQAGAVVLVCGTVSLLNFRGLYFFNQRLRRTIKNLLIVPVLLPAIFTILITLSIINPFPFGFTGVTLIFLLTYFGYFFVSLSEAIESKLGQQFVVKELYGISNLRFTFQIVWPQIRKEFLNLSLIVFIGCFSSLSVPLVASGGRSVNFELFIYEIIFISNDWNSAVVLALIQAAMLLVMGLWMRRFSVKSDAVQFNEFKLKSFPSAVTVTFYLIVYFGSLFYFTAAALTSVRWDALDLNQMLLALGQSLVLFSWLAAAFTGFLVGLIFLTYQRKSLGVFRFFLTPSSIIVGFAFYLFFSVGQPFIDLLKMTLGLFVVYSFGLFFNFIAPKLELLEKQILTAKIYNIEFKDCLKSVLWPQLYDKYFLCLSILLLVSLTDFAVIKAVGSQTETLGTFIYNYISSYRLQWAFVFSFMTLIVWLVFLNVLRWGFYVLNKKSKI